MILLHLQLLIVSYHAGRNGRRTKQDHRYRERFRGESLWSIVSKAALRSRSVRMETEPESEAVKRLLKHEGELSLYCVTVELVWAGTTGLLGYSRACLGRYNWSPWLRQSLFGPVQLVSLVTAELVLTSTTGLHGYGRYCFSRYNWYPWLWHRLF